MKAHYLLKLFVPPLVGLFFFSLTIITSILLSDIDKSDFGFFEAISMILMVLIFGFPVALFANIIGLMLVSILRDIKMYTLTILTVFGFIIGSLSVIIFSDKNPAFLDIIGCGLSGAFASLSFYFLDKKYST